MSDSKEARRTETIKLKDKQGRPVADYAKVAQRVLEIHADNATCDIQTNYEFKEGWCLFTATVTTKKGKFNGHSLAKVGDWKAFEKAETIAVGRAIAFAGYLASGEIATYEEINDVEPLGISMTEFLQLCEDWKELHGPELEQFDEDERRSLFAAWVYKQTGEMFATGVAAKWRRSDYEVCRRVLDEAMSDGH